MDEPIKLRNAKTEQECDFDSVEAANNFGANVQDVSDWHLVGDGAAIASPEEVHTLTEVIAPAELTDPVALATIAPVDAPDAGAGDPSIAVPGTEAAANSAQPATDAPAA